MRQMVTAPDNMSEQGVPRALSSVDVYVTELTSEGCSSSGTEPIWIGFEALGSGVVELYFGPLSCTLAYFPKRSLNHVGRRFCSLSPF
jgi:hypothetical protein